MAQTVKVKGGADSEGLARFEIETMLRIVGGETKLEASLFESMNDATNWVDERQSDG
jgi:hypothetical protein